MTRGNSSLQTLTLLSIAAALTGFAGCAAPGSSGNGSDKSIPQGESVEDFQELVGFEHKWAIDMKKVHEAVPSYGDSARFVAASAEESMLPPEFYQMACEREQIVGAEGVTDGECFLWGNMQRVNYDHTPHVDDPSNPIVNIIDEAGNRIDPPGFMNIIALKNDNVENQDEIHKYLRNGDILVYFHPEDEDIFQFRMHHAAMYYDTAEGSDGREGSNPIALSLGGERRAHHVDNPVSYGPAFDAGASSTPFHVFRFNPNGSQASAVRAAPNANGIARFEFKCGDETNSELCPDGATTFTISNEAARLYAYQARNWALVTNDSAPFASFHTMNWRDSGFRAAEGMSVLQEVDEFTPPLADPRDGKTKAVYCAGLVYTNFNLALNRPMNEGGLGSLWNSFKDNEYGYDDYYMQGTFSNASLRDGVGGLRTFGQLIFEPTTASRIVDEWAQGYFRGFDASFARLFAGAAAGSPEAQGALDGLFAQFGESGLLQDSLAAEIKATAAAGDVGGAGSTLARVARASIIGGAAPHIAQGFSSLREQSNKGQSTEGPVASPERIAQYAGAYAMGGAALAEYKQLELSAVENRYVPPPMYHWEGNRPDSLISYVGTVLHVDLLAPLTADSDTGSGNVDQFAEGGPDSSLYEHYFVPNGGRHVQRILDVSAGPEFVGPGSKVTTRLSASNAEDIRIVLHPAGSFPQMDRYACERESNCIGDAPGIYIPITEAMIEENGKVWEDVAVTWEFFDSIEDGGLGCTVGPTDGTRECPAYNYTTKGADPEGRKYVLGPAYGLWTLTVIDAGEDTEPAAIDNCAQCSSGGAHSNQWRIQVRNDTDYPDPSIVRPDVDPTVVAPPGPQKLLEASGAITDPTEQIYSVSVPLDVTALDVHITGTGDGLPVGTEVALYRNGDSAVSITGCDSIGMEDAGCIVELPMGGSYTVFIMPPNYDEGAEFDIAYEIAVTYEGGASQERQIENKALEIANGLFRSEQAIHEFVTSTSISAREANILASGATERLDLDNGGTRDPYSWVSLGEIESINGIGPATVRKLKEMATTQLLQQAI